MSWGFGRQVPDSALMRFVALRFPYTATCLDIGSGEGANARELAARGHRVFSIDSNPKVQAPVPETPAWHAYADICEYKFTDTICGLFDIIYDINTLCHVEHPPWEKIKGWLKPEGIFFSICPTYTSPLYIKVGKDFTRTYGEGGLRETLNPFFKEIRIFWRSEPDFKNNSLESWIVEARP